MKLVELNILAEGKTLARAIVTEEYNELLPKGTVLKKEYIEKLSDIGVKEVYIEEDSISEEDAEILKEEVKEKCRNQVRTIISKHTYNADNSEMAKLTNTAEDIISNILEDEEVVAQIYEIRERSADIYEHSISVCSLSMLVALRMKLDQGLIRELGVGCLLHEIGLRYITVEYENINIPELSEKEIGEYKKHPIYGFSAIQNEDWLTECSKDIILGHHERIDGSGYPLHTTNQPIEQCIVQVCDFFDEVICGIGYERLKVHEVIEYLKIYKGQSFKKEVVDELFSFVAVYPAGTVVITSNGERAMVVGQNKGFPERPVLRLLSDKAGNLITEKIIIDLMEHNSVFIKPNIG